jgi:hypothetical protein
MTSKPPSSTRGKRPFSRLVVHDIRLVRRREPDGSEQVKALVDCDHYGCEIEANRCAQCAGFARIEPHEAGYILLCHPGAAGSEAATDDGGGHGTGNPEAASEPEED